MMPATGLRRISVASKRCLRTSGSCCSLNMAALSEEPGDFHAVEAEVVLAALVAAARPHVVEIGLHVAPEHAGVVGHEQGALAQARLHRARVVEGVFLLGVDQE